MNTEEKNVILSNSEEEVVVNLKKSGIYLLEKSINWFKNSEILEMLLSISNMQIAMELLLKAYICRTYGFENILTAKMCRLRDTNYTAYLKELKRGQIKTLGFEELKTLLNDKKDTFSPVIEDGRCPCFGIEYDYLEGNFAKGIHKSVGTVKKYLPALIDAQLITAQHSINAVFLSANNQNFFTLPNEIFLLKLPPSAFMVYAYLLLIEDRRTHTCHPSYNTIAAATGMSRNTVIKSICVLLDKGLIEAEHSHYLDQHGLKWNGNNLYTILPTQRALDKFHQKQLDQLELAAARRRVRNRQEKYDLRHPRATCTPPVDASPFADRSAYCW